MHAGTTGSETRSPTSSPSTRRPSSRSPTAVSVPIPPATFVSIWSSQGQDGDAAAAFAARSGLNAYGGAQVDVVSAENAPAVSDLNGVLESGETVVVEPTWTNRTAGGLAVTGTASDFSGPAGPTYDINIGTANYGTIPATSSAELLRRDGQRATSRHGLQRGRAPRAALGRPAPGEDRRRAFPRRGPSTSATASRTCLRQHPSIPFVENLFHNGITGGCAGGGYCPASDVTRAQMAVFLLKSEVFRPTTSLPGHRDRIRGRAPRRTRFAPWIENLAALGHHGRLRRRQLLSRQPRHARPDGGLPAQDRRRGPRTIRRTVRACSPTCRVRRARASPTSIEELYSRQITGGCSTHPLNYCPTIRTCASRWPSSS